MTHRAVGAATVLFALLAVAACTGPPTPTPTATPDAGSGDTTSGGSICPAGTTVDADFCLSPDADPALRDVVADVFATDGLAAVIAGIWKDGEPMLVGAMGDSFPGDAATIDMHHLLGNWATPMLSTVLLQQVDAGVVALDDPLSNWLPDVPEADQITLEMLARSTSGFAQYTSFPDFADSLVANPFRRFSPEEVYAFGVKDGTTFPPGTDWRFSDTNFILLGAALEAATGKPVSELMREGIWEPLGLDGMTPPTDSRKAQPVLHGFGNPRGPWEDLTYWTPTWIGYAGGVSGNQEEVARFIEALAEGSLVSAESHEEQFANASLGMTGNTEEKYYAMGFSVVDGWIFNNPNLPGYRGGAGHFDGWTIVVYTTQGIDGDPDAPSPTTIFERLSEILVPDQPMIYSD